MTSMQNTTNLLNVDKWSTREQLCLASAISVNSEQNWNAVSASLNELCDVTSQSRPNDWFSQENCAVQYEQMLEEVNNKACSSSSAKSPVQVMLGSLTEERVQELRTEIRKEQEEYAKLYTEIKAVQTNYLSNEQVWQMWLDIQKEQEMHRIEEMTLENRLREREEKKNDLKKTWHPTAIILNPQLGPVKSASVINSTLTNLDAETILGSSKTNAFKTSNNATSPLLSSLLKSSQHIVGNNNGTSPSNTSSIRTSAPTITTLLTGGSIANANQPAIIPSHDNIVQLLARPISGPPLENVSTTQVLLSPSQSAPTISMLLEKTKGTTNTISSTVTKQNQPEPNTSTINITHSTSPSTDVNNEPIPMDIEEDLTPTKICERAPSAVVISDDNSNDKDNTNSNNGNVNDNVDDTASSEEQQLLEVFKNIGNIEELGIDDVAAVIHKEVKDDVEEVKGEEVTFLESVADVKGEESQGKGESKIKSTSAPTVNNNSAIKAKSDDIEEKKEKIKHDADVKQPLIIEMITNAMPVSSSDNNEIEEKSTIKKEIETKVEIISSDDSNDNLPLSTVASINSVIKEHTSNTINTLDTDRNCAFMESDKATNMKNEHRETELNNSGGSEGVAGDAVVSVDSHGDGESSLKDETLKNDKKDISIVDLSETKECKERIATKICEEVPMIVSKNSKTRENFEATGVQPSNLKDISKKEEEWDIITIPIKHVKSENKVELKLMKCVKTSSENEKDVVTEHNMEEISIVTGSDDHTGTELSVSETRVNVKRLVSVPIITVADTDEDSSTTDASTNTRKDEKSSTTGSKLNRRNANDVKKADNMPTPPTSMVTPISVMANTQAMARSSTLRKLRERDRSESPMIDDETSTTSINDQSTSQRLRRRYSPTNNDSVPNSPASSDRDERELRASKKSLLSIFNILNSNKYGVMIQRLFNEESFTNKLKKICLRRMDLHTIKKNIESGQIRTTHELQRDILLMCQNAQMVVGKNSSNYKIILAFQHKCESIREFMRCNIEVPHKDTNQDKKLNKTNTTSTSGGTTSKSRSGSRKSSRIS